MSRLLAGAFWHDLRTTAILVWLQSEAHELGVDDVHSRAADLLLALETEMRRAGMWSAQPPTTEVLASAVPFGRDRMALETWLQFLLVPRLAALIEHGSELPSECAIRPLAEVEFAARGADGARLLEVLGEFDALLHRPRAPD